MKTFFLAVFGLPSTCLLSQTWRDRRRNGRRGRERTKSPRGLSFHVCARLNLPILSRRSSWRGVGAVSTEARVSLPLQPPLLHTAPLLNHSFTHFTASGVPLRPFPWSLGSSLCHVAQSEPSLGRITQLSMGGQMTIIRLHSSGPYLKREERSPRDLR